MRMQCAEPSLSAPAREQPGGSPAGAQSPAVTTMKSVMEAKVRDLQNQLEYLRAQLASELMCKVRVSRECLSPFRRGCMLDLCLRSLLHLQEELGRNLAIVTEEFAGAKREWQSSLEASTELKRRELSEVGACHALHRLRSRDTLR
jgi:hypothetical protein